MEKGYWIYPVEINWGYKAPKIFVFGKDRVDATIKARLQSGLGRFDNWKFI